MMIKGLIFCISLICVSCTESEKSNETTFKKYGPAKLDTTLFNGINELERSLQTGNVKPLTLRTSIEEICQTAGCWIQIKNSKDELIRVRFKDHFTIPTKTPISTKIWIHGVPTIDTLSVELLKHFAEDAGTAQQFIDTIKAPAIEYGFEADAIGFYTIKK